MNRGIKKEDLKKKEREREKPRTVSEAMKTPPQPSGTSVFSSYLPAIFTKEKVNRGIDHHTFSTPILSQSDPAPSIAELCDFRS